MLPSFALLFTHGFMPGIANQATVERALPRGRIQSLQNFSSTARSSLLLAQYVHCQDWLLLVFIRVLATHAFSRI